MLILVNLIYAANFTIAKSIMPQYIDPYGFIFLRISISMILYAIIYFIFIHETIHRKDVLRLIACGFFGIAFNQLMFFKGISLTNTVHSSLLMILTPIITFILSKIILKDTLKWVNSVGILLGAAGTALLILEKKTSNGSSNINGDICIIINAISYAIYLTIVKPLMAKYHPITVIFYCFLFGFPWACIVGAKQIYSMPWNEIPPIYYTNIIFVVLGATFIVYLLNIAAMKSLSPAIVSSYIYLQPLFAIIISMIFADEVLTKTATFGGICIIFGLWLINYQKKTLKQA